MAETDPTMRLNRFLARAGLGSRRSTEELIRAGRVEPVIDKVFPSSQAPQAYARLQAAEQFGKVVIRWD